MRSSPRLLIRADDISVESSVPNPKFVTKFPGGASRLAALLLAHIGPLCSLVAPGDPGAAPGTLATIFGIGTLASTPSLRSRTPTKAARRSAVSARRRASLPANELRLAGQLPTPNFQLPT